MRVAGFGAARGEDDVSGIRKRETMVRVCMLGRTDAPIADWLGCEFSLWVGMNECDSVERLPADDTENEMRECMESSSQRTLSLCISA